MGCDASGQCAYELKSGAFMMKVKIQSFFDDFRQCMHLGMHLIAVFLIVAFIASMDRSALASTTSPLPIAMILNGSVKGEDLSFTELKAGDTLELNANETVDALDYQSCLEIRFTGGKLLATSLGLEATGGDLLPLGKGACSDPLTQESAATNASSLSITLRGGATQGKEVEELVLKFQSSLTQDYDAVLISFDDKQPTQHSTNDLIRLHVPQSQKDRDNTQLQLVFIGKSKSSRRTEIDVPLKNQPRRTKMFLLR